MPNHSFESMLPHLVNLKKAFLNKQLSVATAESCTGGLLAAALTELPGSSQFYRGGINAYANDAKISVLGVKAATIEKLGAVSAEVAKEMAEGARRLLKASFAISVTGIAGPDGGTPQKPVGTVWWGLANAKGTSVEQLNLTGTRADIRWQAVFAILTSVESRFEKGTL
jgi:PncC family amidohydrolase